MSDNDFPFAPDLKRRELSLRERIFETVLMAAIVLYEKDYATDTKRFERALQHYRDNVLFHMAVTTAVRLIMQDIEIGERCG